MGSSRRETLIGALTVGGVVAGIALIAVLAPAGGTGAGSAADPGASTAPFGPVGTTQAVACPDSLASGAAFAAAGTEVEGKTYSCGVVVVPENHAKPDGKTIELFYLKLHSTSPSPEPDPMVYLAGGPGSSGASEVTANPTLYLNLAKVREHRDIIGYDQRGTGYSNYLLCAPFESTLGILQDRDTNPAISAAITDLQGTELNTGYEALRANLCGLGSRLLGGVDIAQYNSDASARDIPELVKALGYADGYSLYGTSYGTRLAQYAMRAVPDGITGVILDGPTSPATPNTMWSATKNVSPYVEVIAQCEADAACNAAYPNLATRFGALLESLATKPLVLDPPIVVNPALSVVFPPVLTQIDKDFFIEVASLNNLAFGGGFASSVPRMVDALERGDVEFLRASPLSASGAGATTPKPAVPVAQDPTPALHADQPLYDVSFTTLLGLAQAAKGAQAQAGLDGQWLTVALEDLAARLQAGENQADLMEALLRLGVVPNAGVAKTSLSEYATTWLSPSAATAANAVASQMTLDDVRRTMWSIQDVAMMLATNPDVRAYSDGMKLAMNCNDEIAFTSLDVAAKNLADSPYPQLAAFPPAADEQNLLSCLTYTTPLDRSVTEPVTSDIPALLFLSRLDNETPVQWGRDVAKGLSRSTSVEWNNLGHVAAAHDPKLCAGNIAAAFLDDPSSPPDTACAQAAEYQLTFTMP